MATTNERAVQVAAQGDGVSKKGRKTYRGQQDGWLVIAYAPDGTGPDEIEVSITPNES